MFVKKYLIGVIFFLFKLLFVVKAKLLRTTFYFPKSHEKQIKKNKIIDKNIFLIIIEKIILLS